MFTASNNQFTPPQFFHMTFPYKRALVFLRRFSRDIGLQILYSYVNVSVLAITDILYMDV